MASATGRDGSSGKSVTIRISGEAHGVLKSLAAETGEPIQLLLDRAIEAYRRQRFFEELNAAYGALRGDPGDWEEERQERAAWDAALSDDIEDE